MNHSTEFDVIDTHTEGEPIRVVIKGAPSIQAQTMKGIQQVMMSRYDHIRTALIHEPRGHKDMFGSIIFPPLQPDSDFGVIFMDTGGYLNMCGHGSMGTVVALIEAGMITIEKPEHRIRLDTPAGTIEAIVNTQHGVIQDISIVNIPAFPYILSHTLKTGLEVDIAFGGNFFALVNVKHVKAHLKDSLNIVEFGMEILKQINQEVTVQHPLQKKINSIDLVHFYNESNQTSLVVFGDAQFDRSPCGTGMCAKMSVMYAQGKLHENEEFLCHSVIGTVFRGKILGTTQIGQYAAIIPQVTGRAFVTGRSKYIVNDNDPLKHGFTFHDNMLRKILDN